MKSNYKPIGDYVNLVEERNKELQDLPLVGLSIQKKFIPSIANTIGTDMSTYRTIYKNQFAYSAVTSRNGDKLTIALFKDLEKGLISQAYTPFEITDTNKLLPAYLMMWFSRPEFDRYARFKSHGSARELFNWDDLCGTLIPVPHPDKQKEIVKEYNTIVNRIALNNQLIKKLEETAQAIYKQWFVDFEFPNEHGKPYKSNGGEMVESELGEIPKGWNAGNLSDLYKFQYGFGNTNPNNNGQYPIYGAGGIIGGYDKFNNEDAPVIGHMGEYCGAVVFAYGKHYVTYNGVMCNVIESSNKYFGYSSLLSKDLKSHTRGSSQPFISYDMIYEVPILIPDNKLILKFNSLNDKLFDSIGIYKKQCALFQTLSSIVLTKLTTIEN